MQIYINKTKNQNFKYKKFQTTHAVKNKIYYKSAIQYYKAMLTGSRIIKKKTYFK